MSYSADIYGYVKRMTDEYNSTERRCVDMDLFQIPVYINITLLDGCPPGLFLLSENNIMAASAILSCKTISLSAIFPTI